MAERRKRNTDPELVDSSVLCLVTVAHETSGRVNKDARKLLDAAAPAKMRSLPAVSQPTAARAWRNRWVTLLSTTIQKALAATLEDSGTTVLDAADGVVPTAVDVWLGSTSLGSFQARAQSSAAPVSGSSASGGPNGNVQLAADGQGHARLWVRGGRALARMQ